MLGDSMDDFELLAVLKLIETKAFRERLCLVSGVDAGHSGNSFGGLTSCWLFPEGVSEGTQKDGRVGFADCIILATGRP